VCPSTGFRPSDPYNERCNPKCPIEIKSKVRGRTRSTVGAVSFPLILADIGVRLGRRSLANAIRFRRSRKYDSYYAPSFELTSRKAFRLNFRTWPNQDPVACHYTWENRTRRAKTNGKGCLQFLTKTDRTAQRLTILEADRWVRNLRACTNDFWGRLLFFCSAAVAACGVS